MNRNLYSLVALCNVLCVFFSQVASAQTSKASFISKPANNSVDVNAPILKVTANVVTGASRYTIELNTSPDFTDESLVKTSTVDNQRTLIFNGLKFGTTYYARAKTNVSDYGKVSKFTTRAEVFPNLIDPISGETETNPVVLKVALSPVPDAKEYTVQLSLKGDFTGPILSATSSLDDQTVFVFKNLKYGSNYFVRAKSDVNTKFGPVARFSTREKITQKRLWGLTSSGGAHNGGTIFSFSVDSATFTKHHDYLESGDYPYSYLDGNLVHAPDGGFYGNSECGREGTCANGELFHVSSQGEFTLLSKPYLHEGAVMLASNNQLYAVDDWINYFQGGIVRLPAEETTFELSNVLFRVKSKMQGQNPKSQLIELADGYLYGIMPFGGINDQGVIYKIRLDGTGFTVIHHFEKTSSGANPFGQLLEGSDGYLYGTTSKGGQGDLGTLFKIFPDGSNFNKLHDFTGTDGAIPMGSLAEKGGRLFGLTSSGGTFNHGTAFRISIDGSAFKNLFNFNGINGDSPVNTPTIVDNMIYGMTTAGGANGNGVIFKMRLDGAGYEKVHDFTIEDGANPTGGLLLSEDFFEGGASASESESISMLDEGVGVFPNPFTDSFTAEIKADKAELVKVMVTDLQGQVLSEFTEMTNMEIPLGSDLEKGVYVLKIVKKNKTISHRIVKK